MTLTSYEKYSNTVRHGEQSVLVERRTAKTATDLRRNAGETGIGTNGGSNLGDIARGSTETGTANKTNPADYARMIAERRQMVKEATQGKINDLKKSEKKLESDGSRVLIEYLSECSRGKIYDRKK